MKKSHKKYLLLFCAAFTLFIGYNIGRVETVEQTTLKTVEQKYSNIINIEGANEMLEDQDFYFYTSSGDTLKKYYFNSKTKEVELIYINNNK